ncbi:GAF and ANTAR domain-containing protein [Nocardioides marmorisolisilvae]|uniref:ANTAR domain-containing protein n=1 Tax=Nocardioides marmorisolisilvae TaxID=1542737 RepID=A0A3N0DXM0_9ACTN|nr:GAF and ANTAR domain-containing protein [Nocardioides marmorisolisilvae]RNL80203.1 ANTAR domain-containing protein [Nocardioides marmorisolisilvae]
MGGQFFDADSIAEMALQLHSEPSTIETLDRVLDYALQAVDCDFAGVTFVHKGPRIETVAATHPLIEEIDQVQLDIGQGPDIDTLEGGPVIVVDDTENESRWPAWAARVAGAGIRSLLGVRLATSEELLGTLNLYSRLPQKFDLDDQAVAHVLARHAAVAIAAARKQEGLWLAADARKIIGQAQGILMERYDLDAERSFAVLVRYSQDNNIKLREVARQLVETRSLPAASPELLA